MENARLHLTLFSLYVLYFVSSSAYAILAPFFPKEAQRMGTTGFERGLVFSIYSLVSFVASPLFGSKVHLLGRRSLLLFGGVLQGLPICLFGFVTLLEDPAWFLYVSLFLRVIQGVGAAAAGTATFALVAASFPERMTSIFGMLETVGGMGMMVGPPLGGFLYELGGFKLPFIVLGGLLLVTIPVLAWLLPPEQQWEEEHEKPSLRDVLKCVEIQILLGCIFLSTTAIGFLDPTLADELDPFGLSPGLIGLMFMVSTLTYALASPCMGTLSEKTGANPVIFAGLIITGVSFLILGPYWIFSFIPHNLWTMAIGLMALGVGAAMILVPAMPQMMFEAAHLGHGASDIISGIINGCFSLGEIVGPMVGSSLGEALGFSPGATFFGFTLLVYAVVVMIYRSCSPDTPLEDDNAPILPTVLSTTDTEQHINDTGEINSRSFEMTPKSLRKALLEPNGMEEPLLQR